MLKLYKWQESFNPELEVYEGLGSLSEDIAATKKQKKLKKKKGLKWRGGRNLLQKKDGWEWAIFKLSFKVATSTKIASQEINLMVAWSKNC